MLELDSLPSPDDPAEALAAVLALRRAADKLERLAVARAIAQGWSWADVAEVLGVSKQAAHKRLAAIRPTPPRTD
ncbi:helix-turn-helix domain-containing protein [Rugamonas rubra]|uniref:Homeodomain-like domain-containing protein n=1 Tax=Rugamonas rubra TaxID=758825 RepID=A0A1I4HNF8_9BURK|nr:helix-turn-helix domain-containing protein [Rugamonas rubra]SFL43725.1 Homeodomain-like domain-containing protein [Rugamonas rubra]